MDWGPRGHITPPSWTALVQVAIISFFVGAILAAQVMHDHGQFIPRSAPENYLVDGVRPLQ